MRRLYAIPLIAVAVLFVFLILTAMAEETKEHADPYLLVFIGITFTGCTIITMRYTSLWTLRSAGVLLTMAGDATLYSFAGGRHFFGFSPQISGYATDMARACFFVGGPLLLVGLAIWLFRNIEPTPDPPPLPEPLDDIASGVAR